MPANAADRRWRKLKRQVAREMGIAKRMAQAETQLVPQSCLDHARYDGKWAAFYLVLGYMQKAEDSHD